MISKTEIQLIAVVALMCGTFITGYKTGGNSITAEYEKKINRQHQVIKILKANEKQLQLEHKKEIQQFQESLIHQEKIFNKQLSEALKENENFNTWFNTPLPPDAIDFIYGRLPETITDPADLRSEYRTTAKSVLL